MSWDMVTSSAFEIQFSGDACPVSFIPGRDNNGAITGGAPWGTGEWRTRADHDLYEDMYPRMRPGLVLARVNDEDVIYLDFDSIMKLIEEAEQPRRFLFTERASKWDVVRARLSDGTIRKLRRRHDGVNPAERAWRRRVSQNMRRGAQKNDLHEFNRWVTKANDIDAQDRERGVTALHVACESGAIEIVKSLLSRNADVYVRDKEGRTCLHGAVKRCHHGVVKALLKSNVAKSGNLVNVDDFQGRTPMHVAAEGGDMKMLFRLLHFGAHTDVREKVWAFLPIHFAACNGHTEVCKWLIEQAGQNVHAEAYSGKQPLNFSEDFGWHPVSKMLREQIEGEPLHMIIDSKNHPWLSQADSALSLRERRHRAKQNKISVTLESNEMNMGTKGNRCERLYLGTWQSLNEWWLKSRGISAVVTLFDPEAFTARAVQRRIHRARRRNSTKSEQQKVEVGMWKEKDPSLVHNDRTHDQESENIERINARAICFAYASLKAWASENAGDKQHEHIKIPNGMNCEKDWLALLKNFPRFGKIFDAIVSSAKHRRVLVVSYDWAAGAAAIASWMMTRRGIERDHKGLPFFRYDEALAIVTQNLPYGTLPLEVVKPILEKLQLGLDNRRQAKLNRRVANLFKSI